MLAQQYVVFIDGEHTNDQLEADFAAVESRLASVAVVVLHDVGLYDLHVGVARLPSSWNRHVVRGRAYKNLVGTVLLHRGFPEGVFREI